MPERPGILLLNCPDGEDLLAALRRHDDLPAGGLVRLDCLPSLPELLALCRDQRLDGLLLAAHAHAPVLPPELTAPLLALPDGRTLPLQLAVLPPLPDAAALTGLHAARLRRAALWRPPDDDAQDGPAPPPARTLAAARQARLDALRMALARLRHWRNLPPAPSSATSRRLLILGGGWTGLVAARTAADSGLPVLLVERDAELGGAARLLPLERAPFRADSAAPPLAEQVRAVLSHPRIEVRCRNTLRRLDGQPGDFMATLADGSRHACGGVLLACGWRAPDITPFAGLDDQARVLSALSFARQLQAGQIAARRVIFLLDTAALEAQALREAPEAEQARLRRAVRQLQASYALNCLGMLRLARAFAEQAADSGSTAFLVFRQMTMPGLLEHAYRDLQAHPGLRLRRAEALCAVADKKAVRLRLRQAAPQGEDELAADLLVLPEIMAPASGGMTLSPTGEEDGPLPETAHFDGYAASNFICFPYETRRSGIHAAGCLREPQTLEACAEDAQGAVLAALRDMRAAARGVAPHPRSGDSACPHFELARCTRCNRCVEECPFGALAVDADGLPRHFPSRCRRCGTCFGACPERVVTLAGQSMELGRAVLRAPLLSAPATGERDEPLVLVLACENDALPALREMQARCGVHPALRIMGVRCLGSVNMQWLADALTGGYDGVLLLGCADGEDSQCHFGTASALCGQRLRNLAAALEERGLDARRVRRQQTARDDAPRLPARLDSFLEQLAALGPNPLAGA